MDLCLDLPQDFRHRETIVIRKVADRKKNWGNIHLKITASVSGEIIFRIISLKVTVSISQITITRLFSVAVNMFVGIHFPGVTVTVSRRMICELKRLPFWQQW